MLERIVGCQRRHFRECLKDSQYTAFICEVRRARMGLHSLGGSDALGGCFAPLPFGAIVVHSRRFCEGKGFVRTVWNVSLAPKRETRTILRTAESEFTYRIAQSD